MPYILCFIQCTEIIFFDLLIFTLQLVIYLYIILVISLKCDFVLDSCCTRL